MQIRVSTLRIIAGRWRSRKISFIPLKGVRPTANMIRETLFNWLAPVIVDSCCLDLFAGSGALGFEALSRGAKYVVMADASIKVIKKLQGNARLLQADNVSFYCTEVPWSLGRIPEQSFNIIFLDPPFNCGLIKPTFDRLVGSNYLAKNALVYVESEKKLDIETIMPKSWKILRQKGAGLVKVYLLQT